MAGYFWFGGKGCGQTTDILPYFDDQSQISYSATGGFDNGKCISYGNTNGYIEKNCTAGKTRAVGFHTAYLGTQIYSTNLPAHLVRFTLSGGSYIRLFNTTSGIEVRRDGTIIGTIGSGTVINSALHHVGVKVFSDATVGTVSLYLDGVIYDSLTGLNTGGADITAIGMGPCNSPGTIAKVHNIYIADDFVGEVKEHLMLATADSSVQFTPSAGSNYQCIDDDGQDGDGTYNSDSTSGHKDLFTIGPAMVTSGVDPKFMTFTVVARKDDAGALTLDAILNQDASDYIQANYTLATSYPAVLGGGFFNILNAMPDSTALDATKINALLMGYALP